MRRRRGDADARGEGVRNQWRPQRRIASQLAGGSVTVKPSRSLALSTSAQLMPGWWPTEYRSRIRGGQNSGRHLFAARSDARTGYPYKPSDVSLGVRIGRIAPIREKGGVAVLEDHRGEKPSSAGAGWHRLYRFARSGQLGGVLPQGAGHDASAMTGLVTRASRRGFAPSGRDLPKANVATPIKTPRPSGSDRAGSPADRSNPKGNDAAAEVLR